MPSTCRGGFSGTIFLYKIMFMYNTAVVQCIDCKRRKIRLIKVNAKCRHLKKIICKGTLRQVFIMLHGLEIENFLYTFSHVGIYFAAGVCHSLWTGGRQFLVYIQSCWYLLCGRCLS
jgi:hypothetical protein